MAREMRQSTSAATCTAWATCALCCESRRMSSLHMLPCRLQAHGLQLRARRICGFCAALLTANHTLKQPSCNRYKGIIDLIKDPLLGKLLKLGNHALCNSAHHFTIQ